jgi:prepilin-type N-terminal cleavage/methylation domain-containing protein
MRPVLLDHRSSQAGYTLVELLVSTAIMVTVTGAIFSLMNPAQGNAQTQPQVADMQQRMRVGNDTLFKELVMSGAGPYQGPVTGALVNFFAPILPRRIGRVRLTISGARLLARRPAGAVQTLWQATILPGPTVRREGSLVAHCDVARAQRLA